MYTVCVHTHTHTYTWIIHTQTYYTRAQLRGHNINMKHTYTKYTKEQNMPDQASS